MVAVLFYLFLGIVIYGIFSSFLTSLDRRSLNKLKQKSNPTEADLARIKFLEKEVPPVEEVKSWQPKKKLKKCSRRRRGSVVSLVK